MSALVAERAETVTHRPYRTTATLILELDPSKGAPEPLQHTQEAGEYKRHSLAAGYWGGIDFSKQPMRQVGLEEAEATFLHGMLDRPMERKERNPLDWLISVIVHVVIVSAVVIAPLAFTDVIDLHKFQLTYLTVPRPPAAPPPPVAGMIRAARRTMAQFHASSLIAPVSIPQKVATIKDEAPEISDGVAGGIPGGEAGGVIGGIIGGTEHAALPGPPPPPPVKKAIYRVGGVVKAPQLLTSVDPIYPIVAKTAHVEGVVLVDAVIDDQGNVVEARAVSGPGLLMPAAVQAVSQWKYQPTILDGQPVSIRMEVTVMFHLR